MSLTRDDLSTVEQSIGYVFRDRALLERALIHASSMGEGVDVSNERLEFLGDAVLQLCISERLYKQFQTMDEGAMTRRRSALVREESLYNCAKVLGLGAFIRMSRGEEQLGGRDKPAVLSDVFEAVLAAVYLDGGYEAAMSLCLRALSPDEPVHTDADFKTRLQEHYQKNGVLMPEYVVKSRSGPPHAPVFEVEAFYGGKRISCGTGRSKKTAEQEAAKAALKALHVK